MLIRRGLLPLEGRCFVRATLFLRVMALTCVTIAVFVSALPGGTAAAPLEATAPDPVALMQTWLLPRYDALVRATAQQEQSWRTFCDAPDVAQVERLRADFRAVGDSWAKVSFISFGPVAEGLRSDRFNFYPDRRQSVSRALLDALQGPDDDRFTASRFTHLSVAVQGLPALERLLFDPDAPATLTQDATAARRCALGRAIALNLFAIASDIRFGWGDASPALIAHVRRNTAPGVLMGDASQLLAAMLTDLAAAYQSVVDLNLLAVMGRSLDDVRPLAGEGRRSGREARIIRLQVESANSLLRLLAAGLPDTARDRVLKALVAAQAAADGLPTDLGAAAADPLRRPALEKAVAVFKVAQRTIVDPLAQRLGVSLGFNALDGD